MTTQLVNRVKCSFMLLMLLIVIAACEEVSEVNEANEVFPAIAEAFGSNIDLNDIPNYGNQTIPSYITKDNSIANPVTDKGALLGRVLFYDKNLSTSKEVSCGSCHKQALAFSDASQASNGVNGTTGRHSMRLINTRFSTETKFFWDERAASLEDQTTRPIQDHAEMGFSGQNEDPSLDDLIAYLETIEYYQELFTFVYGDAAITEERLQESLSQFVRSIQSFDSKFDAGRAQAQNDIVNFQNFTSEENAGKNLFIAPPQFDLNGIRINGGAGCAGCHRIPEFDIDPNSGNNGVIESIAGGTDVTNTRAPSLRDLMKANGELNGPMMHSGTFNDLTDVLDHYDHIDISNNINLDPRLRPGGVGQNLNLTQTEKNSLVAFIKTLAGNNLYTDAKWSDPFKIGQ